MKPLDVWCLITKDGSVSTAHCTCMAGNSEACSHIGALLFTAEDTYKRKCVHDDNTSCTDVLAVWPVPGLSTKVPIRPLKEMNLGSSSLFKNKQVIPTVSEEELIIKLQKMYEMGYTSPLHRVLEPFKSDIAKTPSVELPTVLNLFKEENLSKNYNDLFQLSKSIDISLNEEDIEKIEEATRDQSQNPNWFMQRAGRITASKFKAVCKTDKNNPSLSLIKTIYYPANCQFTTKATSWGISHENDAV